MKPQTLRERAQDTRAALDHPLVATHMGAPIDPAANHRAVSAHKVYLLYDERGEYEDHQEWVRRAFLVPRDFDEEQDMLAHFARAKAAHPEWFRKDGSPRSDCDRKARRDYEGHLATRFPEIPFCPVPWQLS